MLLLEALAQILTRLQEQGTRAALLGGLAISSCGAAITEEAIFEPC